MISFTGAHTQDGGPRCKHHGLPVAFRGDRCYRCRAHEANAPYQVRRSRVRWPAVVAVAGLFGGLYFLAVGMGSLIVKLLRKF